MSLDLPQRSGGKRPPASPVKRYRKSPRLKGFDYIGPLAAHLTFVTQQRHPYFSNPVAAEIGQIALLDAVARLDAKVHGYCLMPDHVHVLVEIAEGKSLQDFAHRFKLLTAFRLEQALGSSVWQVSYHDHVLRAEEAIVDVAAYIWENPVEAGIVEKPMDYLFSGPRERLEQLGT